MWLAKNNLERKDGAAGLVAIAIDKDKGSQNALKWATDNILQRGQTAILIHVKLKPAPAPVPPLLIPAIQGPYGLYFQDYTSCNKAAVGMNTPADADKGDLASSKETDSAIKDLFLPFRCFCTRKDIQCKDVVLEDVDVGKALVEYVGRAGIENLVVGATTKGGFLRFKATDVPASVLKGSPDFCNIFVISKGKVQSTRLASRPPPPRSPLLDQFLNQTSLRSVSSDNAKPGSEKPTVDTPRHSQDKSDFFSSPFGRRGRNGKSYGEISLPDSDISYVSSGRSSMDRLTPPFYDNQDLGRATPRLSSSTESDVSHSSFESLQLGRRSVDSFSQLSTESESLSTRLQSVEEVEAEMRRLKLELKQTMAMYSTACKEALTAKRTATELQRWKVKEERKLEEARLAEEAALAVAELEKAKSRAALEAADAARRIAELEAQKRINAEMKAMKESEEKKKALYALANTDIRYRRYSIEQIESATEFFTESLKIGEGGYGPVYKSFLDHTPVAIKVLRPDASQGRTQFQKEVEVLSCIRHPNMVLLLGACPEYGCLVYEYMENGSLEDRLFRRGNTPPLSWQTRFRIAAEIATGLLFLHQTKPEPLVHRDLKPGNILLCRNFVSKISDVGLARLVPPSVVDNVTQYRMTSTAGTFCYIDPEYQQTGMLGVKSDVYSLGIMLLQMITARPPMGLTHHVGRAIEKGTFADMLDPAVPDWPVKHALSFAKLALKCSELRRKERPDLGKEVLPELNKLRMLAQGTMHQSVGSSPNPSPNHSEISMQLEETWENLSSRSSDSSKDSPVSHDYF